MENQIGSAVGIAPKSAQVGELQRQLEVFQSDTDEMGAICNRIESLIDKLGGPDEPRESSGEKIQEPSGVVGGFELCERELRDRINRLQQLAERLDDLI